MTLRCSLTPVLQSTVHIVPSARPPFLLSYLAPLIGTLICVAVFSAQGLAQSVVPLSQGVAQNDRQNALTAQASEQAAGRAASEQLETQKNALDSRSEMGEMESLRLQMSMDRLSKLTSTLSNMLKKTSEAAATITQNMKGSDTNAGSNDTALPAAAAQAESQKETQKNALDSLSEMGETESLRLQMSMDRLSKLTSTLSNLLKKTSETAATITQNMKGSDPNAGSSDAALPAAAAQAENLKVLESLELLTRQKQEKMAGAAGTPDAQSDATKSPLRSLVDIIAKEMDAQSEAMNKMAADAFVTTQDNELREKVDAALNSDEARAAEHGKSRTEELKGQLSEVDVAIKEILKEIAKIQQAEDNANDEAKRKAKAEDSAPGNLNRAQDSINEIRAATNGLSDRGGTPPGGASGVDEKGKSGGPLSPSAKIPTPKIPRQVLQSPEQKKKETKGGTAGTGGTNRTPSGTSAAMDAIGDQMNNRNLNSVMGNSGGAAVGRPVPCATCAEKASASSAGKSNGGSGGISKTMPSIPKVQAQGAPQPAPPSKGPDQMIDYGGCAGCGRDVFHGPK